MRDANIITLYKNKGDRSDCNNCRGISLLGIVGKTFARVILNPLQPLAEPVNPEAQFGFRADRSTIDMIFSVGQLQGARDGQQGRVGHTHADSWLSPQAPEDDHIPS
ncbi:hypothetical protein PoB_004375000 [Plakobranchus ocellatus]|uniref:Reverse transcriptase domain-containing protein n=1 Tax=Plakobranchus ocellatus TaxID=259542 RepID=A0AAV4B9I9_9GAST|nr:hypothetical protein PoB_004375000 [Plakobranchus ocellatus]